MSYRRGDVLLALFPDSNLRTAKRRPVLVIQHDHVATGLPQLIVAMITSNPARGGPPFRVVLQMGSPASRGTGLRTDSIVMADNLATVLISEIDRKVGTLADMTPVDSALRTILGL
jgi:mRNA interferase MazF